MNAPPGIFGLMVAPMVWWVRTCRTDRIHVSIPEKLIRAALMLPAFGLLLIVLHLRVRLWGPLSIETITADGHRFRLHPPDLVQLYIWLFGVWEPDLTHFIRARLQPGDTFVDVGSYIGYYSVLAAQHVGQSGGVVAIEASPTVFAALRETIALNNLIGNTRLVNKAAAATPGAITVFAGPAHNTGLTTTVSRRGMTAQAQIEALPLDELLTGEEERAARLIKIDVEGGEAETLAGMTHITRCGRPDLEIVIELSPLWWRDPNMRPIDVLQPFIDAGFHAYEMDNNYWPWRYLWPNDRRSPWRIDPARLTQRVKRLDVVLSKQEM